jgi:hypothetical protein
MSEKEIKELSEYLKAILDIFDQTNNARDGPEE